MTTDLDALDAELRRLDVLIEAEIRRMRARYELSLDEFHGLYITDQRVEALLRAQPPTDVRPAPDITAFRAADATSRWRQLADALELDDDERDVLLVCLAPELDAKYETLYAYLNDDVTRRWPTFDLALRLLARDPEQRVRLRRHIQPTAKLIGLRIVETSTSRSDEPRGARPGRVAPPLVDWLLGLPYVDDRLTRLARLGAFRPVIPADALPHAARNALDGLVSRLGERASSTPVVLSGASAQEAAVVAEDLFARAGRLAIVVDLDTLRVIPDATDIIPAIELAQRVMDVGVVASPLDALLEADGHAGEAVSAVRGLARRSPALVLAAGSGVHARDLLGDVATIEISLGETNAKERAAAWQRLLPADVETARGATRERLIDALADRFALGVDRIAKAVRAADVAAKLDGRPRPSSDDVFMAARAVSTEAVAGTTTIVTTTFDWDDLILPADAKDRLADVVRAVEDRGRVLDEWGFGRRLGGRRGVTAMFAGPSGTGKTMAAAVVAKTLRLDLHRLELGTVVSKYIGETEKNLDRAFEAARRANAVLFIDEADALLGKRSEVKDAHDRYANVEIAYLLQKLEDQDGIVIVATNLARNIDESFSRRMQFVVEFPVPDARSRELLWRGMLSGGAPIAPDVDVAFLGRQFELAGGDIRNVVLDAALHAVRDGGAIGLGHLLRAIARQYAKDGRVPTEADFREHYRVLTDGDGAFAPASMAVIGSP